MKIITREKTRHVGGKHGPWTDWQPVEHAEELTYAEAAEFLREVCEARPIAGDWFEARSVFGQEQYQIVND